MTLFRGWFWPLTEPPPPTLEACAVTTKTGKNEWRVLVQFRHPAADYDAAYVIRWISKRPPVVDELVRHYLKRPEDFTFVDFQPNPKKQPE